ncbi:hypothetical protein [Mesotoga sp. UBA5847]|jgi:hypothetical protein|uniref:hypothetical protein n=1 Tax=Mesotoga sp. UBA5847 TaxID=1946859 RepID=UPI0025CF3C8A|nr:hypothetical protein [Mesotoga sp. UBA5847]
MKELTRHDLFSEAKEYAKIQTGREEVLLYGKTDGKAVGTFFEKRFKDHLKANYQVKIGNSAKGIDLPELEVDIKVTSVVQPQSSCPFDNAEQKIYGLGYDLLVFVYRKEDIGVRKVGKLDILHVIYVEKQRTADFQLTKQITSILENNGNLEDLMSLMFNVNLPVDDIQAKKLGERILTNPPEIGYLTISNALQWRLQYARVISEAGNVQGIHRIL